MVKNYVLLGMACLWVVSVHPNAQSRDVRKLRAAIESGDLVSVTTLAKKEGVITSKNRQQLLDEAEEKIAYYEDNISVWTSKKDTGKFFGGIALGLAGLAVSALATIELNRQRANYPYYHGNTEESLVSVGFITSLFGVSFASQGYQCFGTNLLLKKSEEVFRVLQKAPYQISYVSE